MSIKPDKHGTYENMTTCWWNPNLVVHKNNKVGSQPFYFSLSYRAKLMPLWTCQTPEEEMTHHTTNQIHLWRLLNSSVNLIILTSLSSFFYLGQIPLDCQKGRMIWIFRSLEWQNNIMRLFLLDVLRDHIGILRMVSFSSYYANKTSLFLWKVVKCIRKNVQFYLQDKTKQFFDIRDKLPWNCLEKAPVNYSFVYQPVEMETIIYLKTCNSSFSR